MKSNKPLVSIIVPIYNAESTIKDCVLSLINQSLKSIEILLINDGSTDNTYKIINELKLQDDRIKVINKQNEGVSQTRNFGITNAKGEFIGFIDSDDYVDKMMYEKLYTKVIREKSDMGICRFCVVNDEERKEESWNINLNKNNLSKSILYNMIGMNDAESFNNKEPIMGSTCRCIYKNEIIKNNNILFDKEITYAEDLLFNIKYLRKVDDVSIVNESLYFYRKKGQSLSLKYREDFYEMINKLMNNIIKICEDCNTQNTINYAFLSYLIEVLRNATRDIEKIDRDRIKKIKEVVKDNRNKERLKNIDFNNLNIKNKFFYCIFYYNCMSLAMIFYIFRLIKNIINKRKE